MTTVHYSPILGTDDLELSCTTPRLQLLSVDLQSTLTIWLYKTLNIINFVTIVLCWIDALKETLAFLQ